MYCICNILASVVKVNILTSSFLLILNVQCMYNVAASFCGHWNHGLRTPNEGINQRNLKIWADVADKIYASAVPKNLGLGVDFRPCIEGDFLTGRP